jgi:hypothetical protein
LDIKFEDSSYVHSKEVVAGASTSSAPSVAARNRANAAPGVPPVTQVTPPPPPPTAPHYGSNIQFVIPKEPKTMNEFTRDWRMCRARGIQVLYRYMKVNAKEFNDIVIHDLSVRDKPCRDFLLMENTLYSITYNEITGYQSRAVPRAV